MEYKYNKFIHFPMVNGLTVNMDNISSIGVKYSKVNGWFLELMNKKGGTNVHPFDRNDKNSVEEVLKKFNENIQLEMRWEH